VCPTLRLGGGSECHEDGYFCGHQAAKNRGGRLWAAPAPSAPEQTATRQIRLSARRPFVAGQCDIEQSLVSSWVHYSVKKGLWVVSNVLRIAKSPRHRWSDRDGCHQPQRLSWFGQNP
jgi:hypothetical protein